MTPRPRGRGIGRDAESLEEVGRPFVAERARVAHRADDDDRLVGADRQVEEVRQLLERVGPAGDDDAGDAGIVLEELVDALGERDPLVERESRAGEVGELLELGPRVAAHVRHELRRALRR